MNGNGKRRLMNNASVVTPNNLCSLTRFASHHSLFKKQSSFELKVETRSVQREFLHFHFPLVQFFPKTFYITVFLQNGDYLGAC